MLQNFYIAEMNRRHTQTSRTFCSDNRKMSVSVWCARLSLVDLVD